MSAHPAATPSSLPLADSFDAGGLIRRVRRACDLSHRDLAERLGIHHSTVARWEANASEPTLGTFRRILALAGWVLGALGPADTESHETIQPMRGDAAVDRQGRRYPAHLDVIGFDEIGPYRVRHERPRGPSLRRAARRDYRDYLRAGSGGPPPGDHPTETDLAREKLARREERGARQRASRDAYCDALVAAGEPDPRTPTPTCSCCDACFELPGCAPACTCRCEAKIIHPDGAVEVLVEEVLW